MRNMLFNKVVHYYIRWHDNILNMNYAITALPYSREINILRKFKPNGAIYGSNYSFIFK